MKVNIAVSPHNSSDWPRVNARQFNTPPERSDKIVIDQSLTIGDMAETLGFDGIWVTEHFGTPYSMSPNPLQILAYYAGRTERVTFGTMVLVLPWWNPIQIAHQIAYLDLISNGRFETIGVGRGVAKGEFDAVGVPRETARTRFKECLDILELAFSQEVFSYEGEIFKLPETSIRPQPMSKDLFSRLYGASGTNASLELIAKRGMAPLFIGNKPLSQAGQDVLQANIYRAEVGLPPRQPKSIQFMYCTPDAEQAAIAQQWINAANRDVKFHYGFDDPTNFAGVKGYEAYAAGIAAASSASVSVKGGPGDNLVDAYDRDNLLIGTPEQIIEQIKAGQKACSYCEIALQPQFGGMSYPQAVESVKLFAEEVLPFVQKMDAPLHAAAIPQPQTATA